MTLDAEDKAWIVQTLRELVGGGKSLTLPSPSREHQIMRMAQNDLAALRTKKARGAK
jgi:hypothetical protein